MEIEEEAAKEKQKKNPRKKAPQPVIEEEDDDDLDHRNRFLLSHPLPRPLHPGAVPGSRKE